MHQSQPTADAVPSTTPPKTVVPRPGVWKAMPKPAAKRPPVSLEDLIQRTSATFSPSASPTVAPARIDAESGSRNAFGGSDEMTAPPLRPASSMSTWADRARGAVTASAASDSRVDGFGTRLPASHATLEGSQRAAPAAAAGGGGVAQRLALGKKLKKDDLAGLSTKDQDALRLYRSLQYRATDKYKEKVAAVESAMREKTLERWAREKTAEPSKKSAVVFVADHLARVIGHAGHDAAQAKSVTSDGHNAVAATNTRAAPSDVTHDTVQHKAATAVPARRGGAHVALPPTAVWGRQQPPSTAGGAPAASFPAAAASPQPAASGGSAAEPKPTITAVAAASRASRAIAVAAASLNTDGVAFHRHRAVPLAVDVSQLAREPLRAKTRSALAALSLRGAPGSSDANTTARPAAAAKKAAADRRHLLDTRSRPFKERLFRRIKKPSKLKAQVLEARRCALVAAASAYGIHTRTAPTAVDGALDGASSPPMTLQPQEASPPADGAAKISGVSVKKRSARFAVPKVGAVKSAVGKTAMSKRAAAMAIVRHLEAVEDVARLFALTREAYDARDKDLLDRRKREYAQAVYRVHHGGRRMVGTHSIRHAQFRRPSSVLVPAGEVTTSPTTVVDARPDVCSSDAAELVVPASVPEAASVVVTPRLTPRASTECVSRSDDEAPPLGDDGAPPHGDDGAPEDAATVALVQELKLSKATAYPCLHLLTDAGAHTSPWMIDERFVPNRGGNAARSNPAKKSSGQPNHKQLAVAARAHGDGKAGNHDADGTEVHGVSADVAVVAADTATALDASAACEEPHRVGLKWGVRPSWWPPARVVRNYVTNLLTKPLDAATEKLFDKLRQLQHKLKTTQPLKYPKQMRYVLGLREADRGLSTKRVKLVVIAPDVECVDALDAAVRRIVDACVANNVPHFFALSRGALGRVFKQFNNRVSLVAMYSAEGAYDECRAVVALAKEARSRFETLMPAVGDLPQ